MTDDQQFLIAMLTLTIPTLTAALGILQGRQTHRLVNGMSTRRAAAANARGRRAGFKAHAALLDATPRQEQDEPL